MKRHRRLPLVLASAFLAGTAFGVIPRSVGVAPKASAPAAGMLSLRDAVDLALRNNLGLAISRADVEKADAGIDSAKAAFDPTFVIGSGFDRYQSAGADYVRRGDVANSWTNNASVYQKFSSGARVSAFTGFDPNTSQTAIISPDINTRTGITLRQPLTKGVGAEINLAPIVRARLNLQRSKVNLRIAAADLIRDTEIAYRTLAAARQLLAIRESGLRSAESLLQGIRIRRRPEIGTATEQDELEAAAEVAARKVDITEARNRLDSSADTLRRLLGEAPPREADIAPPEVESLPLAIASPADFSKFMRDTDAFNPESELRDIDIRDSDIAVASALDNTTPSLDFVAGASTLGRGNTFNTAIEGQWYRNGSDLSAGIELNIPLGQRESEASLRIARRSREQALYRMAETRRSAGYAARSAWRDLASARDRLAVAEAGVKIQTKAYDGARARNAGGLVSVNDVLQAAARLDSARLSFLNAILDLSVADARRARLDGSILPRNGFRWEEIDERAASGTGEALTSEPTGR